MPTTGPYGSWQSPITADFVVSGSIGLGQVALDDEDIYWVEMRPAEGGRMLVVKRTPEGEITDITPEPFSVRTRVHEYGGGAYLVQEGVVYFSNYTDQRLYRQEPGGNRYLSPQKPTHVTLTAVSMQPANASYAYVKTTPQEASRSTPS